MHECKDFFGRNNQECGFSPYDKYGLAGIKMKKSEVNIFGTKRCGSYVFEVGIERLMESFTA
jgi:hypothetical protein